jgi:quinol monooxygenase YgiN
MAIGAIFEGQGITQSQYEQVRNAVAPGNRRPQGMLYHAAGPIENGWTVIEIWESQEVLDRFFQEKLGAALQKANINVQPRFFQVTNIMDA